VEIGFLGASPVLDPIPGTYYPIEVQVHRRGENLLLSYGRQEVELPSLRNYIERLHGKSPDPNSSLQRTAFGGC
jgi:hypothetical protein